MPPHPSIPPGHSGDYPSWETAFSLCTDYRPEYEERVKPATLAVLNGEAEHPRDGLVFDKIPYSWRLLSALILCAALDRGLLEVLDFGGALGVTSLQNRRFLDRLPSVMWHIVERDGYVEFGK